MSLEITGVDQVVKNLSRMAPWFQKELARALNEESEAMMALAKERTPVDKGALRASGHVPLPDIKPTEITQTMGFGGPGVDYAIPVHENLTAHHPVGQAKFLESVIVEATPKFAERLAARVNLSNAPVQ